MRGRKRNGQVPPGLARVAARFAAWREQPRRGQRIPGGLWTLAVEMAESHGLCLTASVLKLNYARLKEQVEARRRRGSRRPGSAQSAAKSAPTFLELPGAALTPPAEWIIELEGGDGSKMRIHLKGVAGPELVALSGSFWSSQR